MENNTRLALCRIIQKQIKIPTERIFEILSESYKVLFSQDSYFSTPSKLSTQIAFVAHGLFRLYLLDQNGNDVTLAFTGENMFMSSYSAVILNKTQPVYIQALEPSEIYAIERSVLLRYCESDVRWKELLHIATEWDCLRMRKRESDFLLYDAQTRYRQFLNDFPTFVPRLQQRYIASYLGISPETLSRIRRKEASN